MKYCSIDIETTGLNPEHCDIIEVGAVIDDLSSPRPYDKLPTFHAYVLPPENRFKGHTYHGDPYALGMHGTIFKRIASKEVGYRYFTPETMVSALSLFLLENDLHRKTVFAGKNIASFDMQFLQRIPNWWKIDNSYRCFDPTPLYLKVGEDVVPPSMAKCLERAGIKETVKHTALEDVVKLIRYGILTKEPSDDNASEKIGQALSKSVVVEIQNGHLKPVVKSWAFSK